MSSDEFLEILPGTEVMKDHNGIHFIHARNSAQGLILLPTPSEYAHDPLNWSKLWKLGAIVNQGIFVIISVATNLSIAPLTPIFMSEWNKSVSQVALLTGACIIALGYANFIIVPASDVFGRRIVTLICGAICIAANIWSATATSYQSFLGARILGGLGAAANESIMTMVVADIFFLHERGSYIGLYFWCYFMGLFVGPIISGNIAAHVSWRWFFWACTIAQALNVIVMTVLFPESRRPHKMQTLQMVPAQSSDALTMEEKEQSSQIEATTTSNEIVLADQYLGRGKPNRSQFNPFQPIDHQAAKAIFRHVLTPVQIFFFPIVLWAAMSMGAAANALLAVNLTQSQGLSAPPYNWSPGSVGFANLALVGGGVIGLAIAGPWSDWVIMRATKKNNGIREPEMRLAAMYPFIAAALIGLVIIGVGYDRHWPWQVIVVLGFGLVGVQVVSIPTIAITYAIDCYKPIAGQIMAISTVCKNTFGFGMTYYYNDWVVTAGFTPPLMMIMALTVGFSLVGTILFPYFGKSMRRWTRASKVHSF
ncbi:hypothetical protein VE02_10348 [Pseudogymnoascus sp. 03VT05]|nr:hypothetical protein VE02_10348 [Pseudogymnoascus sp. 03VT05]